MQRHSRQTRSAPDNGGRRLNRAAGQGREGFLRRRCPVALRPVGCGILALLGGLDAVVQGLCSEHPRCPHSMGHSVLNGWCAPGAVAPGRRAVARMQTFAHWGDSCSVVYCGWDSGSSVAFRRGGITARSVLALESEPIDPRL